MKAHSAHTVGTLQVCEAGGGKVTCAPEALVALTVSGGGAVMAGGLVGK